MSTHQPSAEAVAVRAAPSMRAPSWTLVAGLLSLCGLVLILRSQIGDYSADAGPALAALVAGDLRGALEVQPLMGSFSVLVRVPFAFVADAVGAGELWTYRAGVIPCLVAPAVVGVAVARARGAVDRELLLVVPLLAVLTPASLSAVETGHPEELLTAALCVGAVLAAMSGRALAAGLILGLALASKQWAVLAFLPVLLAAQPGRRLRLGLVAVGIAALLTVPLLAGHPGSFGDTAHRAANAPPISTPATVWFLTATPEVNRYDLGDGTASMLTVYRLPALVGRVSHPLIVLLAVPLAFALWRRRPRHGDVLALLALLFLLRCVLDPVDNEYYHAPLLLSLLAWEATVGRLVRGIPLVTAATAAALWLTFDYLSHHGASDEAMNAAYLTWTTGLGLYLLHALRLLPTRLPRRAARAAI